MIRPSTQIEDIRFVDCKNNSGEVIPAFAVMRVTGVTDGVVQVAKPNAASDTKAVVNGPTPIPIGGYGNATYDSPFFVLYDLADGTPTFGDMWGTESGSWKLRAANEGFCALGGAVAGHAWFTASGSMGGGMGTPMSGAKVTRSTTAQSIPDATFTALNFNVELYDVGGYFTLGSPTIFSPPEIGYYHLGAYALFPATAAGVDCQLRLVHSGGEALSSIEVQTASVTEAPNLAVSDIVRLTSLQTLQAEVFQNSGSAQNFIDFLFWIFKIGS